MQELTCPACDASHEVPESVLSDEGVTMSCPGCGTSFTALSGGLTVLDEKVGQQKVDSGDPDAPFLSGGSSTEGGEVRGRLVEKLPDEIEEDITLEMGEHVVSGGDSLPIGDAEKKEILVRESGSLTIQSGTEMLFDGLVQIVAHGPVRILGTEDQPVTVTGTFATSKRGGIKIEGANAASETRIEHAHFEKTPLTFRETSPAEVNVSDSRFEDCGHALSASGANICFQDCTFRNNRLDNRRSSGEKGGAAILNFGTEATFEDCTFRQNSAPIQGGAVFVGGSKVEFLGCEFHSNEATEDFGAGGAILSVDGGQETHIQVVECTFTENRAGKGGALAPQERSTLELRDSHFARNIAENENSGAIDYIINTSRRDLEEKGNTFEENRPRAVPR